MTTNLGDLVKKGLPVGVQIVTVDEIERTVAKNGNPQIQFKATNDQGVTGLWWRPLVRKGLGFIAADFVAIGVKPDLPEDEDEWADFIYDLAEEKFVGRTITVKVTEKKSGQGTEVTVVGDGDVTSTTGHDANDVHDKEPF